MDGMRQIYIEEANELLDSLETALLALEENANDKSNIEQVFRAMHTLKGNSSMFGLTHISDFLHNLESIYDKVRIGELALSKELLDCTLAALDHLKIIVYSPDLEDPINKERHQQLSNEIQQLLDFETNNVPVKEDLLATKITASKTYHIYFEPYPNFFDDGSNPLLLLAEIAGMGKTVVVPHFKTIDFIEEFVPTECISFWDIYLETTHDEQSIFDVFVFVHDSAFINITEIPYQGLLNNPSFLEKVHATASTAAKMDIQELLSLSESLGINDKTLVEKSPKPNDNTVNGRIEKNKEKVASSVRISSDKLDELMNLVSELITTQASLSLFSENNKIAGLETISENIEKLSRRLRDVSFGMTLVPINNMFARFQRMIRDTAAAIGKEINFSTMGGETALDKAIIEKLVDPFMHLIRNSLDHGIETKEERIRLGKPEVGDISIKAYYSGVFVYIQIADDGKGIDVEAVRNKAIEKGLLGEGQNLSDKEIFNFIFHPGFSTAKVVTDVSGRGVGMDVAKRNIVDLGGDISIDSTTNIGTTITIKLPLTLSIIDGLLVNVDNIKYVVPLSAIVKCYEVENKLMKNNFNRLLILDGEQIPFVNLREEFDYELSCNLLSQIIVVYDGKHKVGISVDAIVDEYQAVIKPLGKYYKNQDFVSGATILGDGTVALVLDTNKVIDLHIKNTMKYAN